MERGTVLRDAIWGDVTLGARELALIDTPAFQRLRRVRQLGFTDLVYPGARHTRFEHSLGVFHLAGLAVDRLRGVATAPPIDDGSRRTFLAAALLHDVGHYPFSHAVEELEVDVVRRHEEIARDLITGELADVLADAWDVDPARVALYVAGPARGDPEPRETDLVLRSVLDSGLDVDKLDYLVRDARGANVPYGVVDVQRLLGSLTVWRDPDGHPRVAVDEKGLAALQSLVFAKHLMFATVYWHHACRAAVAMLLRALQELLDAGGLDASALERADDASLVARLAADGAPDLTRRIGARIAERRLYKRGVELDVEHHAFDRCERLWFRPAERRATEDAWAAAVDAEPGAVLIDVPEPRRITEGLPVVAVDDDDARRWDEVSGLSVADLDRFQRWVRRIRVFAADADVAARLRRAEPELL